MLKMSKSLSNFHELGLKLDVYLLCFNKLNFETKTEKETLIIIMLEHYE